MTSPSLGRVVTRMPEPREGCSRCAGTGLAWWFPPSYPTEGPHLVDCPCTCYVDLRQTADGEVEHG